jgi:hypothetical protein
VSVNAGAKIGGKGAIGGPLVVNADAIAKPGSLTGRLDTGDLTIGAGATLKLRRALETLRKASN